MCLNMEALRVTVRPRAARLIYLAKSVVEGHRPDTQIKNQLKNRKTKKNGTEGI